MTASVPTWQGISAARLATESGTTKTVYEFCVDSFLAFPPLRIMNDLCFPGGQCRRTVSYTLFFASMLVSSQGFVDCVIPWGSGDLLECFLLQKLEP